MSSVKVIGALLGLAVSMSLARPCFAQPTELPEPGIKIENDITDVLGLADPLIHDKGQEAAASSSILKHSDTIRDVLYLTGDRGYLVKVNVETEVNTDISRILGEPELIGSGDNEQSILLRYWSGDGIISASPSPGFHLDADRSFFLWIVPVAQPGGKPLLGYGYVPPALAAKFQDDARAQLADADLVKGLRAADRDTVMLNILNRMEAVSQDAAEKARLKSIADNIREAELKLAGIEKKLQSSLAAEQAGDRFLQMLKVVKLVLSVAVLAGEVDATINVPAASAGLPTVDLNGATDQTILEQRVESWRQTIGGITQTYQGVLTTWGPKLKSAEDSGRSSISPKGVPGELYLRMQ